MPLTSYRHLGAADRQRPITRWPDHLVIIGALILLVIGFALRVGLDELMNGRAPYIFLVPSVLFAAVASGSGSDLSRRFSPPSRDFWRNI